MGGWNGEVMVDGFQAQLNGVEYSASVPAMNKKLAKQQVCLVVLEAMGIGLGNGGSAAGKS